MDLQRADLDPRADPVLGGELAHALNRRGELGGLQGPARRQRAVGASAVQARGGPKQPSAGSLGLNGGRPRPGGGRLEPADEIEVAVDHQT